MERDDGRDAEKDGFLKCYAEDVMPLKGALEKWYFEHRSFWLDLKIIAATALAIVAPGARFYLKWFDDVQPLLMESSLRRYFEPF
jgi:hypothetical protein